MRRAVLRCVLVLIALTVMLQAHIESARWWWAPETIAVLRLSRAQSLALDRLYDRTLPARRQLAEQIVALADRVQQLNDDDAATDADLMSASERLTHAQEERCQMRVSVAGGIGRILSPDQRAALRRLQTEGLIGPY